jgi:hypothetical protein
MTLAVMARQKSLPVLVGVPEPCGEDWEAMSGDERVRSCARCLNRVHDITGWAPGEIEALWREPKVCVSFLVDAAPAGGAGRRNAGGSRALGWIAALSGALLACEPTPPPPGTSPPTSSSTSFEVRVRSTARACLRRIERALMRPGARRTTGALQIVPAVSATPVHSSGAGVHDSAPADGIAAGAGSVTVPERKRNQRP